MANGIMKNWTERVRKHCLHDLIYHLDICLKVPRYGFSCSSVPQTLYNNLYFQAALIRRTSGKSLGTFK